MVRLRVVAAIVLGAPVLIVWIAGVVFSSTQDLSLYEHQCSPSYTLVQAPRNWREARDYCRSRGGTLASIRNESAWLELASCYPAGKPYEKLPMYIQIRLESFERGDLSVSAYNLWWAVTVLAREDYWFAGYREPGTVGTWRWAPDGETFWQDGSVGAFERWRGEPKQHSTQHSLHWQVLHKILNAAVPSPDVNMCLRGLVPNARIVWDHRVPHHYWWVTGRWWAGSCDDSLMFVCEGISAPPIPPPAPVSPPRPPMTPTLSSEPPAPPKPPIAPESIVQRAKCCHDFHRWGGHCCACNNYCSDAIRAFAIALPCTMLPTVMFILYVACRRIQAARARSRRMALPSKRATSPAHATAMELTAWPGVPIGILQFATFQAGLLLLVAGVIPQLLYMHGSLWPTDNAHRLFVLTQVGTTVMLLAIRPTRSEARFVVLASAVLVIVLLGSAAIIIAQGLKEVERNLAEMTPFCKKYAQTALRVGCGTRSPDWTGPTTKFVVATIALILALFLTRNLNPRNHGTLCRNSPMMGVVFQQLSRLWSIWRAINTTIGLVLLAQLLVSYFDPLSPSQGDVYWSSIDEYRAFTTGAVLSSFLCALLTTKRIRLQFLLWWFKTATTSGGTSAPANSVQWLKPARDEEGAVGPGGVSFSTVSAAGAQVPIAWPDQPVAQNVLPSALRDVVDTWAEHPPGVAEQIVLPDVPTIIGRGGFGIVFAAKYRGQDVAVKQLHCLTSEALRLFEREAEMMLTLESHPHLCACIGTCVLPSVSDVTGTALPAIILGLHKGGTLENALGLDFEQQPPSRTRRAIAAPLRRFEARWELVTQLASALAHLHERQLLHRDIKPANVLLDGTKTHAVLADFGMARRATSTPTHQNHASWRYMAPETVWEPYSAASDVYAFSMLMWTIAYAKGVFDSYTQLQVVMLLQSEPSSMRPPLTPPPRLSHPERSDAPDGDAPGAGGAACDEVPAATWGQITCLLQECWHVDQERRPTSTELLRRLSTFEADSDGQGPTASQA